MNKKLLTAAFAAALVVPLAANAGIKVYGQFQAEIATESVAIDTTGDGTDNKQDTSGFTMEDNGRGRFGIKGSQDLGGGLKAIAGAAWKIDTTDNKTEKDDKKYTVTDDDGDLVDIKARKGQASLLGRDIYVGLKGGFGTVELGQLKQPYKYFGGVKYDPFVATNLEARKNGGMGGGPDSSKGFNGADDGSGNGHNGFLGNTIGYKSPNWGGFKLWVIYGMDQNGDSRSTEDTCTDDDGCATAGTGNFGDYQLGAKFGMKGAVPFEIGFVQNLNKSTDDRSAAGVGDAVALKVFASVGFKTGSIKHKVVLQNEVAAESMNSPTAAERAEAVLFVGYHLKIGKTTVVLQTATNVVDYDAVGVEDQTGTYTAFGVIHKLSKKARIFGGLRNSKWTDYGGTLNAEKAESVITVGLRVDI